MELRAADRGDTAQIAALHAASWRHSYRGDFSDGYLDGDIVTERAALWSKRLEVPSSTQWVVVAEIDREIVGFACAYARADVEWGTLLDNIHVAPLRHGQGIGRQMMGAVADWCLSQSPRDGLYLWVLQSNLPAQRFYQALGGTNMGSDVWSPPGGGAVQRLRYAWSRVSLLRKAARKS